MWFELLALVTLLGWLGVTLIPWLRWPKGLILRTSVDGRSPRLGRAVAVVPARNEAAVLPRTLPALLEQTDGLDGVVLVDDGSSDGTAAAAESVGDRFSSARLRVVSAPPKPAGWAGKLWALSVGIEVAPELCGGEVEFFLLTDADILHPDGSVAALISQAERCQRDLVSIMARLNARSFWERLLVPPFVYFFQLLYPFRLVSSDHSRVAAAAGGCVLVRVEALRRAGGIESIHDALIDDVSLGRRIKRSGGRLWLGLDRDIVSIRPYASLREIWSTVSRSAFVQLRQRWDLLLVALAGLALFVVGPAALVGVWSLDRWAAAGLLSTRGGLLAILAWALQAVSFWPAVRHHDVPGVFALTLPLAGVFYGLMTLSSALRHLGRRGVRWKGRKYGSMNSR